MENKLDEFNQQAGESYEEWKYRVIFAKVEKKCKLSWGEICCLLNLECGGDYLRKIAYGVKKYADFLASREDEAYESGRLCDELTELEGKIPGINNYCIAVKENGDDIVFLRKIINEIATSK